MSRSKRLLAGLLAVGLAAPAFADPSASATHVPTKSATPPASSASAALAPSVDALRQAWADAKTRIFAGKMRKPDAEDPDTVNHLTWYEATGFTRPYPGEKTVRPPTDFPNRYAGNRGDND